MSKDTISELDHPTHRSNGIDHTGICVVFMCSDGRDRFAMGKRGPNCRDEIGTWDIGGGAVKFGEAPEKALFREVMEEYGVIPQYYKFLGYRSVIRMLDDRLSHWISLDFLAIIDDIDQVHNAEPHKQSDVQIFTFNTYPKNDCHSQFPIFLEKNELTIKLTRV